MTKEDSRKPLREKLGIGEDSKIIVLNPPKGYREALGKLAKGVVEAQTLKNPLDLIQIFVVQRSELQSKFPMLKNALSPSGALWICWPKASSKAMTDLNEAVIREIGLKNGLVDVKVISTDETWAGLKFVYRLKDRQKTLTVSWIPAFSKLFTHSLAWQMNLKEAAFKLGLHLSNVETNGNIN